MDLSVIPYQQKSDTDQESGAALGVKPAHKSRLFGIGEAAEPKTLAAVTHGVKFKECMRNHAASIGGHANDGCGEFMPRGVEGSPHSLTCAACGCHRNFHRREVLGDCGEQQHHHRLMHAQRPLHPQPSQMVLYCAGTTGPRWDKNVVNSLIPLQQQNAQSRRYRHRTRKDATGTVDWGDRDHGNEDDADRDSDRRSETPERGEPQSGGPGARAGRSKRFRTKFTQEQKERMLEFAERIGWRINKHDDMALNQFCSEVGVKRNVLKVWMHNNKNAHRRREVASPSPVAVAPPSAAPQPAGI